QHTDLKDDRDEASSPAAAGRGHLFTGLDLVVDLPRRLGDQEQSAEQEDQVAAGDLTAERAAKERAREPHHPRDREQQEQARDEGQPQAHLARQRLLGGGQPAADDRDEDEVVDAQDDLERGQGQQRDEAIGGEERAHRSAYYRRPGIIEAA